MTPSFNELFGQACQQTGFFSNLSKHYLHMLLKDDGRIVEVADKWEFAYHSISAELLRDGNVKAYFAWNEEASRKIGRLKSLSTNAATAPDMEKAVMLVGKKNLSRVEEPERFYTAFPTAILFLFRVEEDLLYGTLKLTGAIPTLFPQRPNGIVYIDGDDRITGFNKTFFEFFVEKIRSPEKILMKPASEFLDPTPAELETRLLSRCFPPDPSQMVTAYDNDFRGSQPLRGLSSPAKGSLSPTPEGLIFNNPTRDDLHFTLPITVDTHADFVFEMEYSPLHRETPLFSLGEADPAGFGPDVNGYLIGPDYSRKNFFLKRKGLVQRVGAPVTRSEKTLFRVTKTGRGFFLDVNRERVLAFFDMNFLHPRNASIHIFLRIESSCLIHRVRLLRAGQPSPPALNDTPLTRLKTAGRQAFIINPVDSLALSSGLPGINAFVLENVTEMQKNLDRLENENQAMRSATGQAGGHFVGEGPKIQTVKEIALRAARTDATLLIQGETGTGKEVLAHFVHQNSPRKNGPFIKVDCTALPGELMESELFGHEKGAFTGAVAQQRGHFEKADGGTLFLDEVGNLTPAVQAKLLHFMQDHAITRIGGRTAIPLNIRIVVASNLPLRELVQKGAFRSDLYYRIEVVTVTLPALRERREDLPGLCRHFIRLFNDRHERNIKDLSPNAYEKIYAHPWPGNIRELKNALERAVIFCDEDHIPPEKIDLGAGAPPLPPERMRKDKRPLKVIDEPALKALFQKHGGVAQKVADELAVSRRALYYKVKNLGLSAETLRT